MGVTMRARILVGLVAIAWYNIVFASCANPYRPRVEQHEMGIQMNYMAEKAEICIVSGFKVENDCRDCKSGYLHQCSDNQWKPRLMHTCSDTKERDAGKIPAPNILRPQEAQKQGDERGDDDERSDNEARAKSESTRYQSDRATPSAGDIEAAYQRCKGVAIESMEACIRTAFPKEG